VDEFVDPREEPTGEVGARVVESSAQEVPRAVEYLDGVTGRPAALEVSNFPAIDPGMAGPHAPIHSRLEDQLRHGPIVTLLLLFSEDDAHQERVLSMLQARGGPEAVEPVGQLEAARQPHERPELLGEDHPRSMNLTVDVAGAVVQNLELHVLGE